MGFRLPNPFSCRKIDDIHDFESKKYSQNGEDGIIEAVFSKIGTTNRFLVEFGVDGVEGGTEFNGRKLIEEGWDALLMDGGRYPHQSAVKHEYITADNINELFAKYHVPAQFDMLSIDIDSNDYWVWKALSTKYQPRLVIIEYNGHPGPTAAKSVAYEPDLTWDGTDYFGASLMAMVKLGRTKGYTLIGCESRGVNSFFIRNDLKKHFTIRKPESLYVAPGYGTLVDGQWSGHPKSAREMIDV